ncbi:MAG: hypothetical protein K9J37_20065 [Saprospiraceae bacterium]|nr:hypothetical protein [Saprospiraceae bacterium]MCF8252223.1 hypothetical protein [Saprospiraceae bacterium]MCF8282021.1 hypothetical protein [Bacteroidales bacterium]MCF8311679.1 hypothetical protein [Saprospiraceae bacterium]MCF8442598.1 hypothetical protein [Saprospiraceae bacterium]
MGHIKEPKGIDLVVAPMPFTEEDRKHISTIIQEYKKTGKIPVSRKAGQKKLKKKHVASQNQH